MADSNLPPELADFEKELSKGLGGMESLLSSGEAAAAITGMPPVPRETKPEAAPPAPATPAPTPAQAAAPAPKPSAPAPAPKSAPIRKAGPVSVMDRVERAWRGFWNLWSRAGEVLRGLGSEDRATRRMARLFFWSLVGLWSVLGLAGYRLWLIHHKELMATDGTGIEHIGEFIGKQAEGARVRNTTLVLGSFLVELKRIPGEPVSPGVVNMAELEIVVECDLQETCRYIEGRAAAVRNEITNVLTAMTREDVLSRDGKRRLKKYLLERINGWLPRGRIENVYFPRVLVS